MIPYTHSKRVRLKNRFGALPCIGSAYARYRSRRCAVSRYAADGNPALSANGKQGSGPYDPATCTGKRSTGTAIQQSRHGARLTHQPRRCTRGWRLAAGAVTLGLALASHSVAQIHAPFPTGYAMGNLGTVVWDDGPAGRQPWNAAAIQSDSLRWGVGVAGVDFYDDMDNYCERDIRHAVAGGWWRISRFTLKASYQCFSALSIYYEHTGFLSVGTNLIPFVHVSVEARGVCAGVRTLADERETLLELGATLWVPRRHVAILAAVEHLTVEDAAVSGLRADPVIRLGLHTTRHRFGALGAVAELVLTDEPFVRLAVGEEYWFHPTFAICAALTTEPFMVAFGATFEWQRCATSVAVVHHPVLGWSKGFGVGYAR